MSKPFSHTFGFILDEHGGLPLVVGVHGDRLHVSSSVLLAYGYISWRKKRLRLAKKKRLPESWCSSDLKLV